MKKLDYIDALRGLAILGVLLVHTNQYGRSLESNILGKIISQGARGVQLFYVASAFTLFISYKTRYLNDLFPVRSFFIRRFFRIAPMYYLGIIYYLFQDGFGSRYWLGDKTHISTLNIFSNLTFTHGFNPYWITSLVPGGWSIAVEMLFYAIFPFLFLKIKNINNAFYFLLISMLANFIISFSLSKINVISSLRLWDEYLVLYFPNQLPLFAIGIIMYFIIIEDQSIKDISGKSLLFCSVLLFAELALGSQFIFKDHILFGLVFLILGYSLSKYRPKLLVNSLVNHIGKVSFSMYLVHFAILHWLLFFNIIDYFDNQFFNYLTRYLIVCVVTILISTLFYNFIELPFQNIGRKLITKMEASYNNKNLNNR